MVDFTEGLPLPISFQSWTHTTMDFIEGNPSTRAQQFIMVDRLSMGISAL